MLLVRDCAWWLWCRFAFQAVIWMPFRFSDSRLYFYLLGYAGMYAYSESWKEFRLCVQWNVDGRPKDHPHNDYVSEQYDKKIVAAKGAG